MRCVIYLRVSDKEQAERDDTEEGYSLPAQRDACLQYIRDQGWSFLDEYVDRGESASKRSAERPQFNAMLRRVNEIGDVDAVVVHKLDRFSRDAALHLAVRATLRKRGVALVSVTEKLEETASGRLVEGIQALVNEYHSANLASEVKKGMRKKAELGGVPFRAPLGYLNHREWIEGRRVSHVVVDPDRAPLIQVAFELYATGDYSLESLGEELRVRGLTTRGRKGAPIQPVPVGGLGHILGNRFYTGVVEWNGIESQGRHEPLIDPQTFEKVQAVLASRSVRSISRETKHDHVLKGLLVCGVCGRRLSLDVKKEHTYFYCLGRRDPRRPTGCREAYIPAEKLEEQVEQVYTRVQLPAEWADRLIASMEEELVARQDRNSSERDFQLRRMTKLEEKRRKLLDAYYAGALDITMFKAEQEKIGREIRDAEERMAIVNAGLEKWKTIFGIAVRFATNCADAYRKGGGRTRRQYNRAVFDALLVRDGHIEPQFSPIFAGVFGARDRSSNEIWYPVSDLNR